MGKRSLQSDGKAFEDTLRKHNLKVTPQRIAVYEALVSLGHASADEVASHIAGQAKSKVSVASVYNILTQLTALSLCRNRCRKPDENHGRQLGSIEQNSSCLFGGIVV